MDAFQYSLCEPQSRSFFLSHHHSDHTVGLYRQWDVGLIFCSPITATLLVQQDGLSPDVIRAIPLHRRVHVDGVFVTLIDANHCPGAVIFVFELPPFIDEAEVDRPGPRLTGHGPVYVHCGDFRYCREMGDLFLGAAGSAEVEAKSNSSSVEVPSAIHNHYASLYAASSLVHLSRLTVTGVYLDTTYCRPNHTFPPQAEIVMYTLGVVRDILTRERRTNQRLSSSSYSSSSSPHCSSHSALSASTLTSAWSSLSTSLSPTSSSSPSAPATFLDGYSRAQHQRTLFLVGSYSIGKEKIFLEIARTFGMKIYASPAKLRLIRWIELFNDRTAQLVTADAASSRLMKEASAVQPGSASASSALSPFSQSMSWSTWDAGDVLTGDITASRLHVVPLSYCSLLKVAEYMDPALNPDMRRVQGWYHSVVCFRPTGWVGNAPRVSEKVVEVNEVPVADEEGGAKGRRGKKKAEPRMKKVHRKRSVHAFVHHIPYSEHSSYTELQAFVRLMRDCGLQQQHLFPTVNIQRTVEQVAEFNDTFRESRKHGG